MLDNFPTLNVMLVGGEAKFFDPLSRIFDWTEILRLCHLLFIEIEMFCKNELVNNAKFQDTIPGLAHGSLRPV